MREIKFRAWDEDAIEMVYHDGTGFAFHQMGGQYLDDLIGKESKLMQYSGAEDKNGREIWEGDIVRDDYDRYSIVMFGEATIDDNEIYSDNDVVGFYLKPAEKDGRLRHLDHKKDALEVVGNIYENPELLK